MRGEINTHNKSTRSAKVLLTDWISQFQKHSNVLQYAKQTLSSMLLQQGRVRSQIISRFKEANWSSNQPTYRLQREPPIGTGYGSSQLGNAAPPEARMTWFRLHRHYLDNQGGGQHLKSRVMNNDQWKRGGGFGVRKEILKGLIQTVSRVCEPSAFNLLTFPHKKRVEPHRQRM